MYNILVYYTAITALLFFPFLLFGKTPVFAATVAVPTNVPAEVQTNQSFTFNSEIASANSGEVYFIKCRVGPSIDSLTEGQTYNPTTNTWLSDSGASGTWVNMPTVEVVSGNSVSFSIQCRVKSGVSPGQKYVFSRACLRKSDGTCGTSFQSTDGVTFNALAESAPTPTPTPTPTLSPANTPTPTKTPTLAPTKTPTPTKSSTSGSTQASSVTPTPTKPPTPTQTKTQALKIEESPSAGEAGLVLSQNIATETPTPVPEVLTASFMEQNLSKILIIIGGMFLSACALVFIKWKKEEQQERE